MRIALSLLAVFCLCVPTHAQTVDAAPSKPLALKDVPDTIEDGFAGLASADAAEWTGVAAAATLALHHFDDPLTGAFNTTEGTRLRALFAPGKLIGSTAVQLGVAAVTYGIGRWRNQPNVQSAGVELLSSELLTEGLIQSLKFATRRERPDRSNRRSFPSGHAAEIFATATVLERRFGWAPASAAYLTAAYVAASRIALDRHFLTDIVAGAFAGVIVARTVTDRDDETTLRSVRTHAPQAFRVKWSVSF